MRELVSVFGGTGFLGRRIVRHLLDHGFVVRAASRHPERVNSTFGTKVSDLTAMRADIHDSNAIAAVLTGASAAINAVSLYIERGKDSFQTVHVEGAVRLARLCREAGVERLVHVSGIGANPLSSSHYIRARGEGENAVRDQYPSVTIIRSAVMFGVDDAFLTTLVRLVRTLPIYPIFGRGRTKLQPVYVEDVGEAISRLVKEPRSAGAIYELAGPRTYTYQGLLEEIAHHFGLRRSFLPVPFPAWKLLATVAEFFPSAGLTRNQVELMQRDNVASGTLPGMQQLNIESTPLEKVLAEISSGRKSWGSRDAR